MVNASSQQNCGKAFLGLVLFQEINRESFLFE